MRAELLNIHLLSSVYDNSFTNKFHPASHWICGVSFYIDILLARVNTRIQAFLRQGFAIPSENRKVKSEHITATDKTQLAHRCATVVAKWSPSPRAT